MDQNYEWKLNFILNTVLLQVWLNWNDAKFKERCRLQVMDLTMLSFP